MTAKKATVRLEVLCNWRGEETDNRNKRESQVPISPIRLAAFALATTLLLLPAPAPAHWCSNIYQTFARIVVKADREEIQIGLQETGELKVRVRNNFPYTLHYIKLRANEPEGLQVAITPNEETAEQHPVVAGQEVTFTLQITRIAEGPDEVAALKLEINTTVEDTEPRWRAADDQWVDQAPSAAAIREHQDLGLHQARGLTWEKLAELECVDCQRDGVRGMMDLWASRLESCDGDGFDAAWPMQFLRAGLGLAIRLRFAEFDDPSRAQVVQTMIAALDDAHPIARGYAAFLAAYGGNDAGVADRIQAMLDSDPDGACTFEPSPHAQTMGKAALFMLGQQQYKADVSACAADEGQHRRVRMACAAALGVMGDDAPIEQFLIDQVPNGINTSYEKQYASYLLQLVVLSRRGGPEGVAEVSFLDEEPRPDDPDAGHKGGCASAAHSGDTSLLIIFLLAAFLRRRPGVH